jgi:lysophospholipase L1-like esterase
VAAGEGTLYGYRYDQATQTWRGGDIDATWPGPSPLCHDSPFAYGQVLARTDRARFAQFAGTGATFAHGVSGPKYTTGLFTTSLVQPAQFGDWTTGQHLNARYDRARPDLVLVTLGADDVTFSQIVKACVENALVRRLDDSVALQCTTADPGAAVENDFFGRLPALGRDYATLARWIVARGRADHLVPKVVFTTYYDPFPTGTTSCPDSELLDHAQITYLTARLTELNALIETTVHDLHDPGIGVVDLTDAFDGHRWCSPQPWVYGLSIFSLTHPTSLLSQAPFHPTPRGQARIARLVGPEADRLLAAR